MKIILKTLLFREKNIPFIKDENYFKFWLNLFYIKKQKSDLGFEKVILVKNLYNFGL